jgi:ATP-dependent DNA ligase
MRLGQTNRRCEVKFTEWTRDDRLGHPVFLGLRDDLKASEVSRERTNTPCRSIN